MRKALPFGCLLLCTALLLPGAAASPTDTATARLSAAGCANRHRRAAERVELFDGRSELGFVGENIAAGYGSVGEACREWMNSSGHRANILDADYTHIGGGFARGGSYGRYYVQVFARAE